MQRRAFVFLFIALAAALVSAQHNRIDMVTPAAPELAPYGPNNIGVPSSAPANGPGVANYLHYNPYPNTAAPGQTFECEAGNEPLAEGRKVIGNTPGNQGIRTEGQTKGQLNAKKQN